MASSKLIDNGVSWYSANASQRCPYYIAKMAREQADYLLTRT